MHVIPTAILGLLLLEPRVFRDERGFFFESFNRDAFHKATGLRPDFTQDNQSQSRLGVLRGLHYQLAPKAQGKLVRVLCGRIFDVAVDLRKSSQTFGQWVGVELSDENQRQFWIPEGFAHGFLTLSARADVFYKTTESYAPDLERCIRWDDETLGIQWPLSGLSPVLSSKDAEGRAFLSADVFD